MFLFYNTVFTKFMILLIQNKVIGSHVTINIDKNSNLKFYTNYRELLFMG